MTPPGFVDNTPYGRPLALITGACGGMGLASARAVGRAHDLVLTDFRDDALAACAERLQAEGYIVRGTIAGDLNDTVVVGRLVQALAVGPLGAIVHTAGLSPSLASWQDILRVNLVATERLLRAVEPLIAPGTAAVLIASSAGHLLRTVAPALQSVLDDCLAEDFVERIRPLMPLPEGIPKSEADLGGAAYMLSKWWVLRACEARAAAWGAKGARIVSVSPGMIWTPMGRKEAEREWIGAMVKDAPMARWGTPIDIADTVEFLISARASFITGSDIKVDGGAIGKGRAMASPP